MGFHEGNQFAKRDGFGFDKETGIGGFAGFGGFGRDDFEGSGDEDHRILDWCLELGAEEKEEECVA